MRKLVLTLICGMLVAPLAFASNSVDVSGLIQPGQYQTTMKMDAKGMKIPPMTRKVCVTQDDVDNFASHMAEQMKKSKGAMHIKDMSLQGKHLHFNLVGADGTVDFNIIFDDPTHYHETMTFNMQGTQMTGHATGHRIGACTASSKN